MSEQQNEQSNEREPLFRKETLDRIASPEQLKDYLRVTNPGIWIVLAAVIALLAGVFVWSVTGEMETVVDAKMIIVSHEAKIVPVEPVTLKVGMIVRINNQRSSIAAIRSDEYGRDVGIAEFALPEGTYNGQVVTDSVHAIDFLLKNK
jgi:hypothetical protein